MARINLKKFIAEHYKGGVTARYVIREGVTNSIHAGAGAITVHLWFDRQPGLFGVEVRNGLAKIAITDDGEGFTQENLNYFDEICTGHKDDIGGKGVGRLAFLKYANRVEIRSQLGSELIEFRYTADFTPDDVKRSASGGRKETAIAISELKESINTQVTKLVNAMCDDLRLLLFLKKQAGRTIAIRFTHNSKQPFPEDFTTSENIPKMPGISVIQMVLATQLSLLCSPVSAASREFGAIFGSKRVSVNSSGPAA